METSILSANGGKDYHFGDDSCSKCEEGYGGLNCRYGPSYCLYNGIPHSIPSNSNSHPCKCKIGYSDGYRSCCPIGHVLNVNNMDSTSGKYNDYEVPLDIYLSLIHI